MTEFAFGSIFGLVEHQARISGLAGTRLLRNYVISDSGIRGFPLSDRGLSQAYNYAIEETNPTWVTTRFRIDADWALNLSWVTSNQTGQSEQISNMTNDFGILRRGIDVIPNWLSDTDAQGLETPEERCRRLVIDPLMSIGFDLQKFKDYLRLGADLYEGQSSGLLFNSAFSKNIAGLKVRPDYSVADFFGENRARFVAMTSYSMSQTRFTLFVQPNAASSVGFLFHEALHGFGAYLNRSSTSSGATLVSPYSDDELLRLFGLDRTTGSQAISRFIDDACGEYFESY